MQPIHTLNARSNVMLSVLKDELTPKQLLREIQMLHVSGINTLAAKGIAYNDLRAALVPSTDRHEAGFIFDWRLIGGMYGAAIMRRVLPHLDVRTTQSVRVGDLIWKDQHLVYDMLRESLVLARSFTFQHSTGLSCVYINNLSDAVLQRLHEGLKSFPAYIGYIPATYMSRAKIFLTTTLMTAFLKHGRKVIMSHEDDRSDTENVNIALHPVEEFGYQVFSINETYYAYFLAYKIERPLLDENDEDTTITLNSITDAILPLEDFTVVIEDPKFRYLMTEKLGKLSKAGLGGVDKEELIALIRSKITANYIYSLEYKEEWDVLKFNIMLEVEREGGGHPQRLTVALEYNPDRKTLRVLTIT